MGIAVFRRVFHPHLYADATITASLYFSNLRLSFMIHSSCLSNLIVLTVLNDY